MHTFKRRLSEIVIYFICRYDWPNKVEPEVIRKLKSKNKPRRPCCSESEDKILNQTMKLSICDNESCDNYGKNIDFKNGDQNGESRRENGEIDNENNEHKENGQYTNGNGKYYNENGENKNGNGETECGEEYDVQSMSEMGRTRLEVNDVCYINGKWIIQLSFN